MNKEELEKNIIRWRRSYWDEVNPEVLDSVYDKAMEELRGIDPNNPLLMDIEHGSASCRKTEKHRYVVMSLQKVYNKDDLVAWVKKISRSDEEEFIIEPKYDGITCVVSYGKFLTRGNGYVGEDITDIYMKMCNDLNSTDNFPVRYGELVVRKSVFNSIKDKVNVLGKTEGFKTPRSMVLGVIHSTDVDFYKRQGVRFEFMNYDRHAYHVKAKDFEARLPFIKGIIQSLDYPIDGIVVKIADVNYYIALGNTLPHHPNGAMAFKYQNMFAEHVISSITYGMSGDFITAVASCKPVRDNAEFTVSSIVLPMVSNNAANVMGGSFKVGTRIIIKRCNGTRDRISSVIGDSVDFGNAEIIKRCPFCGRKIEVTDEGVKCLNDDCMKKKTQRLYKGLVALGLKNIDEFTVNDLSMNFLPTISIGGWMRYVVMNGGVLEKLMKYGYSSNMAMGIIAETKKIYHADVATFITAMGIPDVGIEIGNIIKYNFYVSDKDYWKRCADFLKKGGLPVIGDALSERIANWLEEHEDQVRDDWNCLMAGGVPSTGKTVCFTGEMRVKRDLMKTLATKAGYMPVDSVTKSLDLLVIADNIGFNTTKCNKAQMWGIKTIKENEFIAECNKIAMAVGAVN